MSNFQYTLDQIAAINSNANMVITACPGSGKTTVIAEKIRNEVKALPPYQGVIGITFTVKASKELKMRCQKNACDTKASFFGTIDHFCLSEIIHPFLARVLNRKKHPLECVSIDSIPQEVTYKLSTIPSYEGGFTSELFEIFEEDIITLFEHGFVLLELLGIISNRVISQSVACKKYIKSRYVSVYIDEYQDSSEPQHALFLKLLDLGLTSVAVGDTQQSIYAWRGSDPTFIESLTNNPDIFEHHIVNINHRCHPSITNYSNRLYDENCALLPTDDIRVYRRAYKGNQVDIAHKINDSVEYVISNNLVTSYSQIAILVRNNISLDLVSSGLNIPHRVFDEDPLAARNTKVCNLFYQLLRFRFDGNYYLNEVVNCVQTFSSVFDKNISALRKAISAIKDKQHDELPLAIIEIVRQVLAVEVSPSDINLLNKICTDEKYLKHYQPINENEVQVMTLHKSKGLEFELVYHLDLYDWVHPKRKFVQGCYDQIFDNWEQELNLHFVGITRAKKYCVLVTSTKRINSSFEEKKGYPSQFFSLPGLDGLYE